MKNSVLKKKKVLKIAPSMMCVDFLNLKKHLDIFREEKVDYLHIDIMDGHYVPNFTLGVDFIKALATYTRIPLDIHLMVEHVDNHIPLFAKFKNTLISFHPETSRHPLRTIQLIKSFGARCGVALGPSVPPEFIRYLLPDIDLVCVMTVNPGYAGQKLMPLAIEKISEVADYVKRKTFHIEIEVDGNASWQNIPAMLKAGGEVFVAGTSSIFMGGGNLRTNIRRFRKILQKFE